MQLNSSKPILGLMATLFLFWLIFVVLASDPLSRLNRMCSPAVWLGRGVSSLVGLFNEQDATQVAGGFNHVFDGCRLWGWNVFYASTYEAMRRKASEDGKPEAAATAAGQPAVPHVAPRAAPARSAAAASGGSGGAQ